MQKRRKTRRLANDGLNDELGRRAAVRDREAVVTRQQKGEEAMARRRIQAEREDAERAGEGVRSAVATGAETWIDSQMKFFDQMDEVARHWLDRRREALDATRRSMEELRSAENVGDLLRIQQDWVFSALQRLTADVTELSGAALSLPRVGVQRMVQAGEATVHELERAGHEALSAAGSKPGTETEEER